MIAKTPRFTSVDALVFDAYGTLFDVQSVAVLAERFCPATARDSRNCGAPSNSSTPGCRA